MRTSASISTDTTVDWSRDALRPFISLRETNVNPNIDATVSNGTADLRMPMRASNVHHPRINTNTFS
jgi:hypothetical protein